MSQSVSVMPRFSTIRRTWSSTGTELMATAPSVLVRANSPYLFQETSSATGSFSFVSSANVVFGSHSRTFLALLGSPRR